jgi:dTDP-4-amino-4,6-dideoxygalactose transaminase
MPFETWPLGQIPDHLKRQELHEIRQYGYQWDDPYDVIEIFEKKVAEFAGARHAVAVDCCSHGIFLCLK